MAETRNDKLTKAVMQSKIRSPQYRCTYQIFILSMHMPKLVEIHWYLPSYRPEMKIRTCRWQITLKHWRNLPVGSQKQITISLLIPSLVKIHLHLLKLSSGNENMDVSRADYSVKNWRNLSISNPKPDLHNRCTHQCWWKSTDIYSSYRPETKIRMDI